MNSSLNVLYLPVVSSLARPDVVIIGAGIMGLMTARELALAGCRVVLLERGETGQEASWAGGGIVSPLYPWRYNAAVTALAAAAQAVYPRLAAELAAETGIDPEFFACGMLMLDAEDGAAARHWSAAQGKTVVPWPAPALHAGMSGLGTGWREGLWMPEVANIRNPRLLKALRASLQRLEVSIYTQADVLQWQRQGNKVVAVQTKDGRSFSAAEFVVCGGAWTAALLQEAGVPSVPVRPVRGQMLLYRLAPGALPCIVLAGGRYVIPRRDGHVLCGSTLEETGFDKSTTDAARISLMASAAHLWPALGQETPLLHWAGLRPAAPEGTPFIGAVPGADNLWVNAGQFRNGLVLAPASARLLADQMLGRPLQIDPQPYQLLSS